MIKGQLIYSRDVFTGGWKSTLPNTPLISSIFLIVAMVRDVYRILRVGVEYGPFLGYFDTQTPLDMDLDGHGNGFHNSG